MELITYPYLLKQRYLLEERLGAGGLGIVCRGRDLQTGLPCAAKMMLSDTELSDADLRTFMQRCQTLSRFDHPNIIRTHDFGIDNGRPFIVMELCVNLSGRPFTLRQLQESLPDRRLSAGQFLKLLPPILDSVAYLHGQGLVHRDLKPENFLLKTDENGQLIPKLSDFDLTVLTDDDGLRSQVELAIILPEQGGSIRRRAVEGTHPFKSPEQKRGELLDARSDIYSLGLMFYYLGTGFERLNPYWPSEVNTELPKWVDTLVGKALEESKEERWESAEDMYGSLPLTPRQEHELWKQQEAEACHQLLAAQPVAGPGTAAAAVKTGWLARGLAGFNPRTIPGVIKLILAGIIVIAGAVLLFILYHPRGDRPAIPLSSRPVKAPAPVAATVPSPARAVESIGAMKLPPGFQPAPGSRLEPYSGTGWVKEIVHGRTGAEMVFIPAGEFWMGSPPNENGRDYDEVSHRVKITQPFYLGRFEVTQAQWKTVMGNTPAYFKSAGDTAPVDSVSWNDGQEFIARLNRPESPATADGGGVFRLPTEAEWEYACRAGTEELYSGELNDVAWYSENSGSRVHEAGAKAANNWGLYDVHGNVFEWVRDPYGQYVSGRDAVTVRFSEDFRVYRGGGWDSGARFCRSASRAKAAPDYRSASLGLRILREIP